MPGQQLREFLFVDRHFASLERRHPGGVNVHANDRMTNLRETNSGNQSDVTGTYDRNLYGSICSKLDIHNSSSVQQIQNTLAGLARRGGHGYHERAAQPSATSSRITAHKPRRGTWKSGTEEFTGASFFAHRMKLVCFLHIRRNIVQQKRRVSSRSRSWHSLPHQELEDRRLSGSAGRTCSPDDSRAVPANCD